MGGSTKVGLARQMAFLFLGNVCYVLALQLFFIGNGIVAGGLAGLATVINYIVPVSVGNLVFLMNVPGTLVALKVMGVPYTAKVFVSSMMFTVMANAVEFLPSVTTDRFAAAVFGGALYGLGSVCVLRAQTSAGGTDLVARMLLKRFPGLSLGKMFMIVDGLIVLLAVIVYRDIESSVYAVTAIVVYGIVNDRIVVGMNNADICFVITDQDPEPMSQAVMRDMRVGVTNVPSMGMYAKTKKNLLIVVVRPRDVEQFKRIVLSHDPGAFLFVGWANEVTGGGFLPIHVHP